MKEQLSSVSQSIQFYFLNIVAGTRGEMKLGSELCQIHVLDRPKFTYFHW